MAKGKLNRSLLETGGEILCVSQLTLYGDCRRGRRPNYERAARPAEARARFQEFLGFLRGTGADVQTGRFQEDDGGGVGQRTVRLPCCWIRKNRFSRIRLEGNLHGLPRGMGKRRLVRGRAQKLIHPRCQAGSGRSSPSGPNRSAPQGTGYCPPYQRFSIRGVGIEPRTPRNLIRAARQNTRCKIATPNLWP